MGLSNIIYLLSGVSLFLFGMSLMGDGLKKVAGNKLEIILYKLTSNPIKGVLLGTGVTAVIQSSSATSVMVVGFVNSGMMKVKQAIGIILGAILGTSVTGWVIALSDISGSTSGWVDLLSTPTLTGIIAVIGIILRMFCKSNTKHYVGDILMGFAVLMTGMQMMSSSVLPLRESQTFINILTKFSNPIIGIAAGCLITCVLQSASASVGILQALAMTGAISFDIAFPIIMGIGIGAAVPVILSAIGTSVGGKRTAFVYLLINVLGVVLCSALFYPANAIFRFPFATQTMTTISIALTNTLFRLATVIILIPFIGLLEKIVCAVIKGGDNEAEMAEIDRLEDRFIKYPALGLEQSRLAMCSMARKSRANLMRSLALLDSYSDEKYQQIQDKESVVDRYEDKLGTYLVKLTEKELTHDQTKQISLFLHTISDFERISDHAVNLSETAKEIYSKKLEFSKTALHELDVIKSAVAEILTITVHAFENGDTAAAQTVEPLEELIDQLCDEMKMNHVKRIQTGNCTLNQGFVFNDIITNYERVADHCSNIAVAMIELSSDAFETHDYLSKLNKMKNSNFDRYYEEYKKKFTF